MTSSGVCSSKKWPLIWTCSVCTERPVWVGIDRSFHVIQPDGRSSFIAHYWSLSEKCCWPDHITDQSRWHKTNMIMLTLKKVALMHPNWPELFSVTLRSIYKRNVFKKLILGLFHLCTLKTDQWLLVPSSNKFNRYYLVWFVQLKHFLKLQV